MISSCGPLGSSGVEEKMILSPFSSLRADQELSKKSLSFSLRVSSMQSSFIHLSQKLTQYFYQIQAMQTERREKTRSFERKIKAMKKAVKKVKISLPSKPLYYDPSSPPEGMYS